MIRRWMFHIAAAASLLLWATTLVLWSRSYRDDVPEFLVGDPRTMSLKGTVTNGHVELELARDIGFGELGMSGGSRRTSHWDAAGVSYSAWSMRPLGGGSGSGVSNVLRVSIWWPMTVLLIVPLAWLKATSRRLLRARRGLCPTCGYDLTGNASGKCPECATPIEGKASKKA